MANKYLDYSGLQELVNKMKALVKVTGVKGNAESSYRTGNVNLTAANVGAYEKDDYAVGTTDVGIRPLINNTRANRLIFLPADQIIIEKTTDGGVTWESAEVSDAAKNNAFSQINSNLHIPLLNGAKSTKCGIRITLTAMKYNVPDGTAETEKYNYWNSTYVKSQERYFNVREWWFWLSSNNDSIRPEIYCAKGANPNNWLTVFNEDFRMAGRSGSNYIRAGNGKTFGGGTNQTGNYWNWRLIFWSVPKSGSTFASATQQVIHQIRCYGDNVWGGNTFAQTDHLYSWNTNKDATFPAKVTATAFNGNASSATNASKVNNHTVNADVPANAVFTDTTYDVATSSADGLMSAEDKQKLDDIQYAGILNSCDLNDLTGTMVAQLITANTYSNAPSSAGTLEVVSAHASGGQTVQRLYNSSSMWYRYRSTSTWTDWYKVTATKV